jgi:hypothetical protein
MRFDVIVRVEDVGVLFGEKLAERQGEFLVEGILVDLLGLVFALLGGGEEGVVVGTEELGFEVAPGAVESAGGGAFLVDVVDAVAVEFVFEFSAEVGAFERLGEEVAFEGFVLEVVADVGKALLAVFEDVDDFFDYFFDFGVFVRVGRHLYSFAVLR